MQFSLTWNDLPAGVDVKVSDFTMSEEISTPFKIEMTVQANSADLEFGLNAQGACQKLTLGIVENNKTKSIQGDLTTLEYVGKVRDGFYEYALTVMGKPHLTQFQSNSTVFQTLSYLGVAKNLLEASNYKNDVDFEISAVTANFETLPYLVQDQQTDFEYLQYILRLGGAFYFEDFQNSQNLVIGDGVAHFSTISKPLNKSDFRDLTNGLGRTRPLKLKKAVVTKQFKSTQHVLEQDTSPQTTTSSVSDMIGVGTSTRFGVQAGTKAILQKLTDVAAQREKSKGYQYVGATERSDLFAGAKIKAIGFESTGGQTDILIDTVKHSGSQTIDAAGHVQGAVYSNRFTAIPASIGFRPAMTSTIASGFFAARMEGAGKTTTNDQGETVAVDSLAPDFDTNTCYKMRYPFDSRAAVAQGSASPPTQLARPFIGPKNSAVNSAGWHLPNPQQGTVLVGSVQGNPGRPVILGQIPSKNYRRPVEEVSTDVPHIINTPEGNRLSMQDDAEPHIAFESSNQDSKLILGVSEHDEAVGVFASSKIGTTVKREMLIGEQEISSTKEVEGIRFAINANKKLNDVEKKAAIDVLLGEEKVKIGDTFELQAEGIRMRTIIEKPTSLASLLYLGEWKEHDAPEGEGIRMGVFGSGSRPADGSANLVTPTGNPISRLIIGAQEKEGKSEKGKGEGVTFSSQGIISMSAKQGMIMAASSIGTPDSNLTTAATMGSIVAIASLVASGLHLASSIFMTVAFLSKSSAMPIISSLAGLANLTFGIVRKAIATPPGKNQTADKSWMNGILMLPEFGLSTMALLGINLNSTLSVNLYGALKAEMFGGYHVGMQGILFGNSISSITGPAKVESVFGNINFKTALGSCTLRSLRKVVMESATSHHVKAEITLNPTSIDIEFEAPPRKIEITPTNIKFVGGEGLHFQNASVTTTNAAQNVTDGESVTFEGLQVMLN
jgi:uncharacterized protein involved in type VI secretion and phage assembly